MLISKNFGLGARYPLPVWLARAELIFVLIDNGCTPWRDLEAKRTTLSIFFAFPSPLTPNNFRTVGSCKKHFFPLGSIFPAARSEPGKVWCEAIMLPLCYAVPPKRTTLSVWPNLGIAKVGSYLFYKTCQRWFYLN